MSEPRPGGVGDQQMAARELVGAVGQLLEEAFAGESSGEWWNDRLPTFAEAVWSLREEGVITDDQALELLSQFVSQIGEAEASRITSDLLDASFEAVGRHMNMNRKWGSKRVWSADGFGYSLPLWWARVP